MRTIREIQDELQGVEQRKAELKAELRQAFKNVETKFYDVASSRNIKVISESPRMVIVKSSDIIGNIWTPIFYDWGAQAEFLLNHLNDKVAVENWIVYLKNLLKTRKGNIIYFTTKRIFNWIEHKQTIPISAEFVEKVIEEIERC